MSADKKTQDKVREIADQKVEDEKASQIKGGRMKLDPTRGR